MLNYGVRWEFFQPEKDQNDGEISYFDPTRFDFTKAPQLLSTGEIVAGTQNFGNGIVQACSSNSHFGCAITDSRYNTFAPRVGFSYALTKDSQTVLRGGYGLYHDRWAQNAIITLGNYPINQSISIYNTNFSDVTQGAMRYFPSSVTTLNSPWEVPYMQKWSLDIQRQLPWELLLDVGYIGSKGGHLTRAMNINQPRATLAIANRTVSANYLRPYPGFAGISEYQNTANSNYHSLQASAVRRFSRGISLQASYTWRKSIDDTLSPYDIYASWRTLRGLSNFDRRHMLIASYVWEIPFARKTRGVTRKVLHGWQVSGITNFQSGNPLTMGISSDMAGTGAGGQRPNVVAPVSVTKTIGAWFTTNSFAMPVLGSFGNAGRSLVSGPGVNSWDFSFSKRTEITENVTLQFRAEFFNFFNHTQFWGVAATLGASTFGRVTSARDPRIGQLGLRLLF